MRRVKVTAGPEHEQAIRAVASLLNDQRLPHAFVGGVARSAFLDDPFESGSVDVITVMGPEQRSQVATMASNRGFEVVREEVEAAEELDLIPMRYGGIRVHVLVASNALYGRMVADRGEAPMGEVAVAIPQPEDFAILLQMSEDAVALRRITRHESFDRAEYNRKLVSLGLRGMVLPE